MQSEKQMDGVQGSLSMMMLGCKEKSIMSDRDSSPSKHVLNATLLDKGNTVTAILSSGRQLLSLPISPQVQYHESVMSTLAQCDHLECI